MKSPTARAAQSAPEFFSTEVAEARRFYLNLKPTRSRPLTIVCGGRENCSPNYSILRKTFPFYSVEYVSRGRGAVTLNGRAHALSPGCLFSYGPSVSHHITSERNDPLVKYFVDFTGARGLKLLHAARLAPGRAAQVFPPHEVRAIFEELIISGLKGSRHSQELCGHLLECLLLKVAESRAPLAGHETRAYETYQDCLQNIQRNFLRLRTLEQTAQECHVDSAYLCRLFRRYDHQTPYQLLLRLKMNAAAELLQLPGALVKQVAHQIGFTDAFHFSRTFKAAFGMPPDAFKKLRQTPRRES